MDSKTQSVIDSVAEQVGIKNPKVVRDININVPRDLELENGAANGQVKGKGWTMRRKAPKVFPNEPCSCGSGRKAKKCCYSPYKK